VFKLKKKKVYENEKKTNAFVRRKFIALQT